MTQHPPICDKAVIVTKTHLFCTVEHQNVICLEGLRYLYCLWHVY